MQKVNQELKYKKMTNKTTLYGHFVEKASNNGESIIIYNIHFEHDVAHT